MNPAFWWCILPAVIGVAAGFQGIYERYRKDSFVGAATLPGLLYLLSRGALPAGTFALLFVTGIAGEHLWQWALGCGTASEVLLRSNFFIKTGGRQPSPSSQASTTDVMVGPLDLLKWWQELALSAIGTYLSGKRLRFVDRYMPKASEFVQFCKLVKDRLASLQDQDVAAELCARIDSICAEYQQDSSPDSEHYRIGLGLMLERRLSRKEFVSVVPRTQNAI